jgi:malonyl-CoA O-methyltransferase
VSKDAGRKQEIRGAFDRAAPSYDAAAVVQREICHRLAEFGASFAPATQARLVVDAGCGTGYGLKLLDELFPHATGIALDFSPAMLSHLPDSGAKLPLCGDLEAWPLKGRSVDAIWSSLALQWCDPATALKEQARVLRPGGITLIATLGPSTLFELRDAFAKIDDEQHVIGFHPMTLWKDEAFRAGFDCLATENAPSHARATDLRSLLRDIKAIGAHTIGPARRRNPLGRAAWRTLESAYEAHRESNGMLVATYDVILLALKRMETPDA